MDNEVKTTIKDDKNKDSNSKKNDSGFFFLSVYFYISVISAVAAVYLLVQMVKYVSALR